MVQLDKAGYETHGLEPSAPFRDRAISKLAIDPQRLKLGTVEDADYPEASFDFINLCVVLEHISDPGAALERALRWLKPGGVIHVEVPSADWLIVRLTNLYYRLRGTDCVGNLSPMHPPYHLHEFTVTSFREHGRKHGYTVERDAHYVCPTYLPKFLDIIARPLMAWTRTGMEVAVWLRKSASPSNGQVLAATGQTHSLTATSAPTPLPSSDPGTMATGPQQVPGTVRPCPQCGSDKKIPYTPLKAHHLVTCGSCGLVFTALEPSTEDLVATKRCWTRSNPSGKRVGSWRPVVARGSSCNGPRSGGGAYTERRSGRTPSQPPRHEAWT
jgi:rubredoxin